MKTKDLAGHISATYKWLRYWIAGIAFALPFVLWIGGHLKRDLPLQDSMSAYYHASIIPKPAEKAPPAEHGAPGAGLMRDEFVGILVAVGMILFIYQGVTKFEDWALNLAGVFAACVAFWPMPWPPGTGREFGSLHGAFAIAFFLCIAYICIFRAADTLPLLEKVERQKYYQRRYQILGWAMPVSPLVAWALSFVVNKPNALVFWVETLGIWVFAGYWWYKGKEIGEINDQPMLRPLQIKPHSLTDAFTLAPLVK